MNSSSSQTRIQRLPRLWRSWSWGSLAQLILVLLLAAMCGLAIVLLPARIALGFSLVVILLVSLLAMFRMPTLKQVPQRTLVLGLLTVLALYFIWPRNVFLPLPFLPVKHPQRLLYLLYLAYALYVLLKCPAVAQRLRNGLAALPWISGAWLALTLWQFLALVTSEYPLALFGGWFVDLLVVNLVYPLVLMVCDSPRDGRRLMLVLLAAAAVNVLFALPETLLKRNLFERFITLEYLDPQTARQIIEAKVRGGQFRAQGSFDHPLLFAEFLAVCLPIAGTLAMRHGGWRWIGSGLVLLLLAGLYLSHSRVAIVASLLVGLGMFGTLVVRGAHSARRNPWPLVIALFALPLLVTAAVVTTEVVQDVTAGRSHDETSSTSARLVMLQAGSQLVLERPLLGYGPNMAGQTLNFQNTFGVMTLDNYLLALALDAGLPALAMYLSVMLAVAWRSLQIAVSSASLSLSRFALAILGGVCAFGPIKLVLGTALNNALLPVLMALLAVAVIAHRGESTPALEAER